MVTARQQLQLPNEVIRWWVTINCFIRPFPKSPFQRMGIRSNGSKLPFEDNFDNYIYTGINNWHWTKISKNISAKKQAIFTEIWQQ